LGCFVFILGGPQPTKSFGGKYNFLVEYSGGGGGGGVLYIIRELQTLRSDDWCPGLI